MKTLVVAAAFSVVVQVLACSANERQGEVNVPLDAQARTLPHSPSIEATSVSTVDLAGGATVYGKLVGSEDSSIALYSDEEGVVAIDEHGSRVQVVSEAFREIVVDPGLGLVWLDRGTAAEWANPGLFILDVLGSEADLTKVTRLTRGFEIVGLDGSTLALTEGQRPYRVVISEQEAVSILTHPKSTIVCGAECEPSAESLAVVAAAIDRRRTANLTLPGVAVLRGSALSGTLPIKDGAMLDVPDIPVVLRFVRRGDGRQAWHLYDQATQEYMSVPTLTRSGEPAIAGAVNHLMVCEGGRILIINFAFYDSSLERIDTPDNHAEGVCLNGGTLFRPELMD